MIPVRVVIGGWSWKGVTTAPGDVLDAPSEQWIDNRIADGGLVERIAAPIAEEPAIETATALAAPETAVIPRPSAKKGK
jgi:hypothetical protein